MRQHRSDRADWIFVDLHATLPTVPYLRTPLEVAISRTLPAKIQTFQTAPLFEVVSVSGAWPWLIQGIARSPWHNVLTLWPS